MPQSATPGCAACDGWQPPLSKDRITQLSARLDPAWIVDDAQQRLTRRFAFKGYAKPVYTANLAAYLGDQQGHHPDIRFGWGYCEVSFTSHELGYLSENDFFCAARLDALTT